MKAKLSNFIALDLGSSKIVGIAAHVDKKGETRIFSQSVHHSAGIKSGLVTDLKAAENSIISTIYALEKECERNIKQVAVSLSGGGTKSYYVDHKIKIYNPQITKQDVRKLIQKALSEFKVKDQEVIHYFPMEFVIDGNNFVDDPVGMVAKELSCQLHIISVSCGLMTNLTNCLAKCQIEITNVMVAIYASGLACLSEDEKQLGAIIIDIGAKTTSFGVFLGNKIIYTGHVPMGSSHITADIAKIFSVSLSTAEKLKVLHGNTAPSKYEPAYNINLEDLERDELQYGSNLMITSNQLAEVIQPRVEEIMLMVKQQYTRVAIDHLIARRLVITGGGSMLRGIKEHASRIFEKQARIGKPIALPGFAEDHNPGIYSAVVGIIRNYARKQQKNSLEVSIDKIESNDGWLHGVISWLKENI